MLPLACRLFRFISMCTTKLFFPAMHSFIHAVPLRVHVPVPSLQTFNEFNWGLLQSYERRAGWGGLSGNHLVIDERGAFTPFNCADTHTLMAQVRGRKMVTMAPPSAVGSLYPYPAHHPADKQCQVDMTRPDLDRFPAFAALATPPPPGTPGWNWTRSSSSSSCAHGESSAGGTSAGAGTGPASSSSSSSSTSLPMAPPPRLRFTVLCPGDVLFVPSYWWHAVSCPWEDSMAINFAFKAAASPKPAIIPLTDHVQRMSLRRNMERLTLQSIGAAATNVLFAKLSLAVQLYESTARSSSAAAASAAVDEDYEEGRLITGSAPPPGVVLSSGEEETRRQLVSLLSQVLQIQPSASASLEDVDKSQPGDAAARAVSWPPSPLPAVESFLRELVCGRFTLPRLGDRLVVAKPVKGAGLFAAAAGSHATTATAPLGSRGFGGGVSAKLGF